MGLPERGRREEVWEDEWNEVAALYQRRNIADRFLKLAEMIGLDESKLAIFDHDVHVAGDLDTLAEKVTGLVVRGDLIVDGCLLDYDHPETFVLVTGRLRARDVITSGWLDVLGDAEISGSLLGDYNDCSAWFGGDVSCRFFYPEKHHIEVRGRLETACAFGDRSRLAAGSTVEFFNDKRILDHLDHGLVRVIDDTYRDDDGILQGEIVIDDLRDFRELKRRVRAGESITPAPRK